MLGHSLNYLVHSRDDIYGRNPSLDSLAFQLQVQGGKNIFFSHSLAFCSRNAPWLVDILFEIGELLILTIFKYLRVDLNNIWQLDLSSNIIVYGYIIITLIYCLAPTWH